MRHERKQALRAPAEGVSAVSRNGTLLPTLRFRRVREPGPVVWKWELQVELRHRLYVCSFVIAPYVS